ncbi:hypothetical protein MKW94_004492 [Papaver nudicaule]|uniref:Uncharacterized protein n=1 Tax=Papaver nudicaule TaxID=74823 RepID=A0AA41VFE4_PAPNU|nr:hypothetical protein [Papaver nudicaule]
MIRVISTGCTIQILLLLALGNVKNNPCIKLFGYSIPPHGRRLGDNQVEVVIKCPSETIQITQSIVDPLPGGLPQHLVVICNVCSTNCIVSHVHLSCGAFSSAQLIPPNDFRRVRYNDCLVNGGRQMIPGDCISFNYAESFPYPLAVSSVECKSNPRGLKHHH